MSGGAGKVIYENWNKHYEILNLGGRNHNIWLGNNTILVVDGIWSLKTMGNGKFQIKNWKPWKWAENNLS